MLHDDDDDDDEMDACEDEEVGVDGANGTAMDVSGQSGSESGSESEVSGVQRGRRRRRRCSVG